YEELGTKSSRFEDALDRLPQAVVVTDLDAQILFSNRAARRPTFDGGPSMAQLAQTRIVETMEVFRRDRARVSTSSVPDSVGGGPLIVKSVRLADHNEASLTVIYSGAEDTPTRRLPAWTVLSVREQEIADLVSQGLTTKQIAQQAFITENTVKKHLQRIFAKTDTRNRAELVQRIWAHAGAGHSA
ncbi:MAG: hypothetical protein J0H43_11790, partial [Actinobacteria bacterium]|nr:hypothetical protein [Actinomycetota bacterium]